MTTLPKLACGVRRLIDYAISAHVKHHQGRHPKRIELHPEARYELLTELARDYYYNGVGPLIYRNVEIVIDPQVRYPRLITWRNEIDPI